MKNFESWGLKTRRFPEYNYSSTWYNLHTDRWGFDTPKPLPPTCSEFYDVSLGTYCDFGCPFCYVGANNGGRHYTNVVDKAKQFFGKMDSNQKPYQIAIGSESEPTTHPEFLEFLETIFNLGIVPNYTTNGMSLAKNDEYTKQLIEYTNKYVGGVAVSTNDWKLMNGVPVWKRAIEVLKNVDTHINLHMIISDRESVDRVEEALNEYHDIIHTIVLLPLVKAGRAKDEVTQDAFDYLREKWNTLNKQSNGRFSKVAFGAHFYPFLISQDDSKPKIKCSIYEPESFSKNLILDDIIKVTPSSFDRKTILYQEPWNN